MNLAIEIRHSNLVTSYSLIDRDSKDCSDFLLTSDDLETIKSSEWYFPLKTNDKKSLLDNCTDNQLITAIYFYIDINPVSESLMKQWFLDTGCLSETAIELSRLVNSSRIKRLYEDTDIVFDGTINNNQSLDAFTESSTRLSIGEILETMESGKPLLWSFDSFSHYSCEEYSVIDLSVLRESKIVIEDHHCIIIGFSVNYTTFLEFVAAKDEELLSQLCTYVDVSLRDNLSIGSVLISQPLIINDITASRYSVISFYGIGADGKLTLYPNNPDIGKICHYYPKKGYNLMPFFLKIHK